MKVEMRIQTVLAGPLLASLAVAACGGGDNTGPPGVSTTSRPAESADPTKSGTVMHYTNGWMGGGMWVWMVIGVLVAALLAVVIGKQSKQ
jgi:hypothetical protein